MFYVLRSLVWRILRKDKQTKHKQRNQIKSPVSQLVNADVNSRVTVLKAVLA